jgi:hypothetical protein
MLSASILSEVEVAVVYLFLASTTQINASFS